MHSDAFRCIQMHSDAFRCIQMHSDAFRCIQCLLLVLKDSETREDSFEDCVAAPGPGPMADASPLSVHIANSPDGSRTHGWVPRHAQTGEPRATICHNVDPWIIMDHHGSKLSELFDSQGMFEATQRTRC